MAIRLTKTSKIIFAISIVVLSGALGYLIWRVNQPDRLDPTDSEAVDCPGTCEWAPGPGVCIDNPGKGCELYTGSCPSGTDLVTAPDGVTKVCCDLCDAEPEQGDTIYPNQSDCQAQADRNNAALDPDWFNNPNDCPDGDLKWVCASVTGGYRLDLVSCTQGEEPPAANCGTEPTYTYNKAPTSGIGPFPEAGEVVLFYKSLLDADYRPKITLSHNGKEYEITMPALDGSKRARVETGIKVVAGDTITLVKSDDNRNQGTPDCEPGDPKYISFGWTAPSGGLCGSGLLGPPTNGTQTPMDKVNISSDVTWATSFGKPIVGKGSQCWADWREWPGDYDFNDYFLQISYIPEAVIEETEPIWGISKSASESCIGEETPNPISQLTYVITVSNTGDGTGYISKIEDILDDKVLSSFIQPGITTPGSFSSGTIVWDYTSSGLEVPAGSSKTFTYTVNVDKDSFGSYGNEVTLTTQEGTYKDTATINADCVVTPDEEPQEPVTPGESVPQTGIFDTTVGRITVGLILVLLGGVVYSMPNGIFKIQRNVNQYKYRERFERKVAKK